MVSVMEAYILIIQVCLFVLTCIAATCEVIRLWADTWKSVVTRFVIVIALTVLGYNANQLVNVPYFIIFSIVGFSVITTVFTLKYILEQTQERAIRLSKINRPLHRKKKRCLFWN